MATFVKIYPQNPNEREIERVVKVLRADGVIVYPTDGVYAFGCSLQSPKAVERLAKLRDKSDKNLSIVCTDISMADKFTRIDNWQFKLLKRNTPGAFTFLLERFFFYPTSIKWDFLYAASYTKKIKVIKLFL